MKSCEMIHVFFTKVGFLPFQSGIASHSVIVRILSKCFPDKEYFRIWWKGTGRIRGLMRIIHCGVLLNPETVCVVGCRSCHHELEILLTVTMLTWQTQRLTHLKFTFLYIPFSFKCQRKFSRTKLCAENETLLLHFAGVSVSLLWNNADKWIHVPRPNQYNWYHKTYIRMTRFQMCLTVLYCSRFVHLLHWSK